MALRAHLRIVDALIDLQYARIRAVERDFNAYLQALQLEFDAERVEINNSMVRQRKDFVDMTTAMELEFDQLETDVRTEFDGAKEEIKNKSSEEYNVLKISLESTIEDLEKQFEQAHQTYLASTEQRTQMFRQLTKQDADAARKIEKRMRKLERLQNALQHWRIKIASNSREWEEKNRAMTNEKAVMSRHYQSLKANMVRYRSHESAKLKALSLHSGAAIKDLEEKLELAHRILVLAQTARKLETEQEKITPFPVTTLITPEEAEAILAQEGAPSSGKPLAGMEPQVPDGSCSYAVLPGTSAGGEGGEGEAEGRLVEEWEHLDGFLQRFNKVVIDRVAIEREKGRLEKENEDLRTLLKQYLDGISVNENVINNPANPLFIVNGKLQLNHRNAPQAAGAAPADPRKAKTLQYSNPAAVVGADHGNRCGPELGKRGGTALRPFPWESEK